MKRLLPWLLGAALAHGVGCSRREPAPRPDDKPEPDASTTLVEAGAPPRVVPVAIDSSEIATPGRAVAAFAMDLHRVWRTDTIRRETTAALSPLSLAGGLALVDAGARGDTREELSHALHLSSRVTASDLLRLEGHGATGFAISRGQRAFLDPRLLPIEAPFRDALGDALAMTDFRDLEGARGGINRWVGSVTKQRITTLLPPGSLGEKTRLVLVDALAASAKWATPFDPAKTHAQSFTTLAGTVESLPMMVAESVQRFSSSGTYEAIDFACADREHALLVIAPRSGHFDEVDAALDLPGLDGILASLALGKVIFSMPRFQAILPATSVKSLLLAVGVERLFSERADLHGITRREDADLHVADALHAARIDVDESGAQVAAATGVVLDLPSPKASITLDRPFLFWLRNVRTGAPVVMGRFMGTSRR